MQPEIGNEINKKICEIEGRQNKRRHAFVQRSEYFVRLVGVTINFDIGEANFRLPGVHVGTNFGQFFTHNSGHFGNIWRVPIYIQTYTDIFRFVLLHVF
jgi:hypothetical protein